MMDLYGLLVETLIGGFWMSVLFMMLLMLIIFAMGGVSFFSVAIFMFSFLLAMSIGYGSPAITIIVVACSFIYFVIEMIGFIERGGGQ